MRFVILAVIAVVGCDSKRERVDPLVAAMKACPGDGELECPRPILNVKELRASQHYFRDALGFKVDWEHGSPPNFGSVSRSDLVLFLCEQCQGSPGAWVFTFTKDVDKLHRELADRGALIRMPPTNMEWGLREMQVNDPDGNVLRFAGPIDHD